MTERLDRIEAILLQNTSQIATLLEGQIKFQTQLNELTQDVDGLRQGVDEFRQNVDGLRQGVDEFRQSVDEFKQSVDEFKRDTRASIEELVQMGLGTYQLVADNSNAIRTMQSEVRGLQVENRRILQELRDRRNNQEIRQLRQ